MFTAEQVWGAAVAAHRINDGYYKTEVYNTETKTVDTRANKQMVKAWLLGTEANPTTEADIIEGQMIRQHFHRYLMLQLSGRIKPFQQSALQAASKDEFTGKDSMEISLISCLPYIRLKDLMQKSLMDQISDSEQITGEVGTTVQGTAKIIKTWYSVEYGKYRITATMNGGFIDFWFGAGLEVGSEHSIKGKIKAVRDDKTTQLNYVKKVLTKA